DQLGQRGSQRLDRVLRSLARSDRLRLGVHLGQQLVAEAAPVCRQLTGHAAPELRGACGLALRVRLELAVPLRLELRAALARAPGVVDLLRYLERRIFPADVLAGGRDFVGAER